MEKLPDVAQKIAYITGRAKQKNKFKRLTSSGKRTRLRRRMRHGAVFTCAHFFSATLKCNNTGFPVGDFFSGDPVLLHLLPVLV